MAESVKSGNMNIQGVLLGIYLLLFVLTLGNFLTFHHDHLLSFTNEYNKVGDVKYYGSLQLRPIRSTFQNIPELKKIPLGVFKRIILLKLYKKAKEEDVEGLEESGCLTMAYIITTWSHWWHLIQISVKKKYYIKVKKIKISLSNAQSLNLWKERNWQLKIIFAVMLLMQWLSLRPGWKKMMTYRKMHTV